MESTDKKPRGSGKTNKCLTNSKKETKGIQSYCNRHIKSATTICKKLSILGNNSKKMTKRSTNKVQRFLSQRWKGPCYVCTTCHRYIYQRGVLKFNSASYQNFNYGSNKDILSFDNLVKVKLLLFYFFWIFY